MTSRRVLCGLVFVLMASGIAGVVFGGQTQATEQGAQDADSSLKAFTSILGLVEDNYAGDVNSETAVYGAIDGMLRTLDPHSRFFDPKAFNSMREDQRGRYYGLGITIATRFGKVTIISPPVAGSPAEKIGLRIGDVINQVNGEPTAGMDQNDVVARIKGPRGTSVKIQIVRPGVEEPLELTAIRDEIAKFTINYAFMIRPRVGYIKLDSFAETSGAELRDALRKLDTKNMDGLIFDLRANPGGVLPAAIEVGETFLQKGQLILETKGRVKGSSVNYVSQKTNNDNLFPLVVLINSSSASASEIVAGAIQDHDSGLIVGQTSFGKGLDQSVYQVSRNTGLALTTQKWYTPSGRLIQRDYSQISQFDYYNHRDAPAKKDDVKHSDTERVVYGGGGITPDYAVEDAKSNEFQAQLVNEIPFYGFARDLIAKTPAIDRTFQVSDSQLADFRDYMSKHGVKLADKDFQDNKEYIKRALRYEVIYDKLGVSEANRTLFDSDPQVIRAIELLPEAKDLAGKAHRQVAQKQ
jgi:carboxyl-terminal processing protease